MGESTIQWTHYTFNAWLGGQRVVVANSTWKKPLAWAREAARAGERRRVFCSSLADVLEVPSVPSHLREGTPEWRAADVRVGPVALALDEARERLWDLIRETASVNREGKSIPMKTQNINNGGPGLDWLLLTKRPENWRLVPEDVRPLVWLGTSVSDQKTAEEWVPRLLNTEGFRHRFLSMEPLLGPVDLDRPRCERHDREHVRVDVTGEEFCNECAADDGTGELSFGHWVSPLVDQGIDWVIVGGESGSKARPLNVEWTQSIVQQCADAGVPCFVKQLGADPRWQGAGLIVDGPMELKDSHGGDWDEWPEGLRVRQFPEGGS